MPQLLPGVPYCLVHGKRDDVVPPEHTKVLWEQAVRRNTEIKGGGELVRLVEPDDTHGLRTVCGLPAKDPESQPLPQALLLDSLVWDLWEAAERADK